MFNRIVDILVSISALIFLSPIMLVLVLKIRSNLGSPVLFSQMRAGLHGRSFKLYKLRSMSSQVDNNNCVLADNQRLTPFGIKLRALSLDELPTLFNVLKGDMTLVGPRPLLPEYLPLYSAEQARRHNLKPGITGWAQINGRNAISWEKKFQLDVWYVDNRSLWLDIKILFRTFSKVLRKEDISHEGEATMTKFTGQG